MIRVVIVEDELLVRLGIKMSLEQASDRLTVVGAFPSAKETLDFFDCQTADILITDIRLPGMSGLEMISALNPNHKDMCKIVLSCYENFDYAREAYELGVDKYILKHELEEDMLAEMIVQLYEAKIHIHPSSEVPSDPSGRENLLHCREGTYLLAGVALVCNGTVAGEENLDLSMISGLLQELLDRSHLGWCNFKEDNVLVCLLFFSKEMEEVKVREKVSWFYRSAEQQLGNFLNCRFFMAVSLPFTDPGKLDTPRRELRQALLGIFYSEKSQLIWADKLPNFGNRCNPISFSFGKLFSDSKGQEDFTLYLKNYFASCVQNNILPDTVRVQVSAFLHELDAFLQKDFGCTLEEICNSEEYPANYIGIQRISGCMELRDWLGKLVKQVQIHIENIRKKNSIITEILDYLQKNYAEEITLENLARDFSISFTYLSHLFKKKTGVPFSKYLGDLRIEHAKKLLATSNMSIEQIARETGFQNTNYFFRLFKKVTGQTAGEFRKHK